VVGVPARRSNFLGGESSCLTVTVLPPPQPVAENVEITQPGTLVFLSYPKYYRDAKDQLTPVITDLVPAADPEWDYDRN
jgi:hypothetical protein